MATSSYITRRGPVVEMILLDWTRMSRSYYLSGAVLEGGKPRIIRPLMAHGRESPVRNTGWSGFLLDGHARWEIFEVIGSRTAEPVPPHLEDVWVRAIKPCRTTASREIRQAIL